MVWEVLQVFLVGSDDNGSSRLVTINLDLSSYNDDEEREREKKRRGVSIKLVCWFRTDYRRICVIRWRHWDLYV